MPGFTHHAPRSFPVLLLALGLMIPACGGGGGGGGGENGADNDLVVVKFALIDQQSSPTGGEGTTNAYRNNRILFTFSAPVDEDTVDDRTIQIGIPSGTNLFLTAPGVFHVDGNEVIFDPTTTDTGPRPFGFEADSDYTVMVRGLPDPKTIRSVRGKSVLSSFTATFRTTDLYLPDLDQPRVLSIHPAAAITIPADRFSPEAQDIWVPSSDDVVVEFSEPMNPATFDPGSSFSVLNTDRGRDVLGVYRFSDDATVVTFRPTFGFGRGPYIMRVSLTVDLTDLAGNAIANPQQWEFLTEYDPTAVNEGLVEEYFDDTTYEDSTFVGPNGEARALWNDPLHPGQLESVFGVSTVALPNNLTPANGVFPSVGTGTWANAIAQVLYTGSEVNQSAGTITQCSWMSYNGVYTGSGNVWTGLTVRLGHSSLSTLTTTFSTNYDVGSPTTMVSNVGYTVPNNNGFVYLVLPTTSNFAYNGTNGLVFEISKTSSTATTNCAWGFNNSSGRYVYGTPSTATTGTLTTYFPYSQFGFRTEHSMAQSLWYKADSQDPMYLDPVITPVDQPPGTEAVVSFRGTEDDGLGAPDPTQESALTEDPTELDGYEYIKFRVRFTANLGTGVGPRIHDILIPYIFF